MVSTAAVFGCKDNTVSGVGERQRDSGNVSAHFWPVLQDVLDNRRHVVTGQLVMGNIYRHYRNQNSLFGSTEWKGKTLAVGLDFSI